MDFLQSWTFMGIVAVVLSCCMFIPIISFGIVLIVLASRRKRNQDE
jgi:hypothetical protein